MHKMLFVFNRDHVGANALFLVAERPSDVGWHDRKAKLHHTLQDSAWQKQSGTSFSSPSLYIITVSNCTQIIPQHTDTNSVTDYKNISY